MKSTSTCGSRAFLRRPAMLAVIGAAALLIGSSSALAGSQTLTMYGAYTGNGSSINIYGSWTPLRTVQDPIVEYDNNGVWQPAYDVGWHPWGEVAGTDSWINCGPSLYYCTGIDQSRTYTAHYRVRFTVPADWSNPTLTLTLRADNEASVRLNGQTIVQDFAGSPNAQIATVSPPLQAGVNELDFTVIDWGGIAGFNYRADLSFDASGPATTVGAGATPPVGCAAGTYSSTGSAPCNPAPAGSYVAGAWASSATPCAPGTYSALPGATACTPAPAETYVGTSGATDATPCPAGSTTKGQTAQTACTAMPPTITFQSITPPNGNGWNNGPVTITWTCANSQSPSVSVVVSNDGANQSAKGTCLGLDGTTISDTHSGINIDTSAPTITYTGSAGAYTVDQSISITCAAGDALSGVASSTCKDIKGDAYTFAIGNNDFSATAIDKAGNQGSGSGSFRLSVTGTSLCALTQRWVAKAGVANSFCVKLSAGALGAYRNEMAAQSGKAVDAGKAAILIALSKAL